MSVLELDKKVVGGEIHFVFPDSIGSVRIQKVNRNTLIKLLKDLCLSK